MHRPKQASIEPGSKHMGKDAVEKVHKGVRYDDAL